jgi:hypothetical protein
MLTKKIMNDNELKYEKEGRRRSKLTEIIEEHLSEESFTDDLASECQFNVGVFLTN